MAANKKVYDIAVEVEEKWIGKKKKEGKELEYERDFARIEMMNI